MNPEQQNAMPQAAPQIAKEEHALMIAKSFVQKYYEILKVHPEHMYRFYKEDSSFTVVDGINKPCTGTVVNVRNVHFDVRTMVDRSHAEGSCWALIAGHPNDTDAVSARSSNQRALPGCSVLIEWGRAAASLWPCLAEGMLVQLYKQKAPILSII